MITVNNLINQAFQRCSLVGDGQAATGTQAMQGLNELKSLISELNGQNLILSDVETIDCNSNGTIRIMEELPEGWSEVDTLPAPSATIYGHICKCNGKVYACEAPQQYIFEWVERPDIDWPDLLIKPLPDRVSSLARKLGNRYVMLYPAEQQVLDSRIKQGLPTFYSSETQLETVKSAGKIYNYEVFIIRVDTRMNLNYRITYLKSLPNLELNDKLYFSERIISILEDGLCAKLCLRYKLIDVMQYFEEEFANSVRLLKRANQANRPMTYADQGGSYLDSYYDAFAPRAW